MGVWCALQIGDHGKARHVWTFGGTLTAKHIIENYSVVAVLFYRDWETQSKRKPQT